MIVLKETFVNQPWELPRRVNSLSILLFLIHQVKISGQLNRVLGHGTFNSPTNWILQIEWSIGQKSFVYKWYLSQIKHFTNWWGEWYISFIQLAFFIFVRYLCQSKVKPYVCSQPEILLRELTITGNKTEEDQSNKCQEVEQTST